MLLLCCCAAAVDCTCTGCCCCLAAAQLVLQTLTAVGQPQEEVCDEGSRDIHVQVRAATGFLLLLLSLLTPATPDTVQLTFTQ